jgi:hypothetical protein
MATAISFLQGLVFLSVYISNNVFPQPLFEADESSCLYRLNNLSSDNTKVTSTAQ